jgi:uncharacterized membrane protein YfcA
MNLPFTPPSLSFSRKLAQIGKFRCGLPAGPDLPSAGLVELLGLGLLISACIILSAEDGPGAAASLVAVFLASIVSSIAGFAFSALCGALLFHLMNPVYAVQVMIVCSIAIQLFGVAALWRSIDWRSLPVFMVGGVLGVPAGVYLLLHLQAAAYRDVIGGLLVVYGFYLLLRWPAGKVRAGPLADACVGFLSGVTGGIAGFPGAFVTIWCGLKGWNKERQRGVYQPFILAMQPVALVAIGLMRPAGHGADAPDLRMLVFVPAALLGAWLGLRVFKRLSDRQFSVAVNALLIVSGIAFIF